MKKLLKMGRKIISITIDFKILILLSTFFKRKEERKKDRQVSGCVSTMIIFVPMHVVYTSSMIYYV